MPAAVIHAPQHMSIEEVEAMPVGPGDVNVRVQRPMFLGHEVVGASAKQ